jgi:hypothetical protein
MLHVVWHELIGHGLVGILAGGHITNLDLFGFRILPEFGWSGVPGSIHVEDIATPALHEATVLAGPLSTLLVSVLAVALLWFWRRMGLIRMILVCLSLWWYDLLSETLLVWGIPKYMFYSRPAVHYEAALELGIPSSVFHVFSIGISLSLLAALAIRLVCDHKRAKQQLVQTLVQSE